MLLKPDENSTACSASVSKEMAVHLAVQGFNKCQHHHTRCKRIFKFQMYKVFRKQTHIRQHVKTTSFSCIDLYGMTDWRKAGQTTAAAGCLQSQGRERSSSWQSIFVTSLPFSINNSPFPPRNIQQTFS